MIRRANKVDKIGLKLNLKNYFEISPIALNEQNNWGGSWSKNYAPSTKPLYKNWQDNEFIESGWKITVLVDSTQISADKYYARKRKI